MLLVLVQPPPDLVDEGAADWRTWVETPVHVVWANLIPNEPERWLRVAYYQSTIEGCARPGSEELQLDGRDILVRVTLMQPPPTAWAIPCDEEVVELDTVLPITSPLEPGQTHRVIVNEREVTTFVPARCPISATRSSPSRPSRARRSSRSGSAPVRYELRVVSGMPVGSSCSQFNGYEIRRAAVNRIDVLITHHQVADPDAVCTKDYPLVETTVPLGADFEPGVEYTVIVNADTTVAFVAASP